MDRSLRVRKLSATVLVAFVLVAAGLFLGARRLVDDQEHRLLKERTAEVGALLSSALQTSLRATLSSLSTAAQQSPAVFERTAQSLVTSDAVAAVALLAPGAAGGGGWMVRAAAGKALSPGAALSGPRRTLASQAGPLLRSTVFVAGGKSHLAVALAVPGSGSGTAAGEQVVYYEIVTDPNQPAKVTESEPFHELNAALYAGDTAAPSKLLLTTAEHLPLTGHVARSDVAVGADTWLVEATARQPLAGALLANVPWLLGAAVLLVGLAMAALVEAVSRRRDYAMALVAQRTMALEHSLGELEQAQQAAVANERLAALGQMAATVGHELRNPLGVLTNALYLIRNAVSATADDRLHRQLDTADREVSAATLIVSDLLEFSRPRAANPVPVDVTELLAEAVSVAPPPSGIEVVNASAGEGGGLPPAVADRDQLRQVVLNLLTNAYEAMPTGGTVRLAAREAAGAGAGADAAVEITVSDTGAGMDEQTRAQVFEPFFSQKTKGTGLGLAVSKRIVDQHGGTLTLISQPGQGCTAVVRLPLTPVGSPVTSGSTTGAGA